MIRVQNLQLISSWLQKNAVVCFIWSNDAAWTIVKSVYTVMAMKAIKCVVVGDGSVGKTSLLITYANGAYPELYIPPVLDSYSVTIIVDNQTIKLELWDTAGQEDYDRLRPLSYPNTDVFIVCFSLDNPASLSTVRTKWCPEVYHYCPNVPIILLGTKQDLVISNLGEKHVTFYQAVQMKKEVGAIRYIECSAIKQLGLSEVFECAVRAALLPVKKQKKRKGCIIL